METIALTKPFKLQNEKEITELQLKFEDMSVADFRQVKKLEAQITDNLSMDAESMAKPRDMSFEFQLASGFLAAIKGTDGLMVDDFTRLPMRDAMTIAKTASFFWLGVD
jgi:hypothetical protein